MSKTETIKLALGAALLVAVLCFGYAMGTHREKLTLPILPGAQKTRLVYLKMTANDWKKDEAYGSVYPSVKQARAALVSNPQDLKAHRTLARRYVQEMYKGREHLAPAITEYQAALVADPDNPVTKSNLAAAYAQTGQHAQALALYEQVKSYPPLEETAEIAVQKLQSQPHGGD